MIFKTQFDSDEPWVASVEVDRQNNIKGTRTNINANLIGEFPPKIVNGSLHFFSASEDSGNIGWGGGFAYWFPFRLDHNTVWNDGDTPIEDNGWIFSFRLYLEQPLFQFKKRMFQKFIINQTFQLYKEEYRGYDDH